MKRQAPSESRVMSIMSEHKRIHKTDTKQEQIEKLEQELLQCVKDELLIKDKIAVHTKRDLKKLHDQTKLKYQNDLQDIFRIQQELKQTILNEYEVFEDLKNFEIELLVKDHPHLLDDSDADVVFDPQTDRIRKTLKNFNYEIENLLEETNAHLQLMFEQQTDHYTLFQEITLSFLLENEFKKLNAEYEQKMKDERDECSKMQKKLKVKLISLKK